MNYEDYKNLKTGETVKVVCNHTKHGIPLGSEVDVIQVTAFTKDQAFAQVVNHDLKMIRFVKHFEVDYIHAPKPDCLCPKCNSGLRVVNKDVAFVSSHTHYAKKQPYTRLNYGSNDAIGNILAVLNQSHVPLTANEISTISHVKLKTVRNVLGVCIISKSVHRSKTAMYKCLVTRKKVVGYQLPKMKEHGFVGERKFDFNTFAKRCGEILWGKESHLHDRVNEPQMNKFM